VEQIPFAEARASGMVIDYRPEIHAAYIEANLKTSLSPDVRDTHVVFTGLHGTGDTTVAEVLAALLIRHRLL
jgi:adenylylsulfate kinase-like enzyme